jgi:hypothetical protein
MASIYDTVTSAVRAVADVGVRTLDTGLNVATGADQINDRTLGQSEYDFNYRFFPEDLATSSQVGHYMVININVPVYNKIIGGITGNELGGVRGAYTPQSTLAGGGNEYSKVDVLRFGYGLTGGAVPSGAMNRAAFSLPRSTRRIKESIALFMPSGGLTYVTENQYEEISLTALGGKVVAGMSALAAGAIASRFTGSRGAGAAGSNIGKFVSGLGGALSKGAKLAGMPINPRIEVLYSHTNVRGFIFQFMMAPKNQNESLIIKNIVRTLRLHAVPELDPLTYGFTYVPPAEFDITFYHKGVENTNIPRINTCVLTRVEVEYDPTGAFSTFHNGHPVAVRLALNFQEVEPLHKARVYQGF